MIKQKNIFDNIEYKTTEEWLEKTETALKELGYSKYSQDLKNEDFAYWKSFYKNDDKIYQVGVFFYDFRKYGHERIGISYETIFINIDARIDLSVIKNITISEFEQMSETFYNSMKIYAENSDK
jgi:hypothetical protein